MHKAALLKILIYLTCAWLYSQDLRIPAINHFILIERIFFFFWLFFKAGSVCITVVVLERLSIDQTGLELRNPPAPVSQSAEIKGRACAATTWQLGHLDLSFLEWSWVIFHRAYHQGDHILVKPKMTTVRLQDGGTSVHVSCSVTPVLTCTYPHTDIHT